VDGQLATDLPGKLFLAAIAARLGELLEELLDLVMVFFQKRDRVRFRFGHRKFLLDGRNRLVLTDVPEAYEEG
jgi:hypothetical protein